MADENGAKAPEEPKKEPQEPDTTKQMAKEPDAGKVVDSHGQPGINKERHDKEVAQLTATIKELQAQLDEQAKTQAGREEMGKRIAELEQRLEDESVNHKLEMAKCRNVKAARALLEDHGGDVSKLKEAEPWLFETERQAGATGVKPASPPSDHENRVSAAREAAGTAGYYRK